VATRPGQVCAVLVADCLPVLLADREGRCVAAAHAGWRGLAAGVVDAAFDAFTEPVVAALLGPSIGPCCYEFGVDDLASVADGVHAAPRDIAGTTSGGRLALDVTAAVTSACAARGADVVSLAGCTGCAFDGFSHRARGDAGRHVVAAWREVAA
jgi:copper oxidase (laccase) domain-containing protein